MATPASTSGQPPSELRLFISSTFRDLDAEREHLIKKVFPEIRAVCRSRGVTFTDVDLRWGLTEEEGTLGRIIRICLEEIDRCRPYFLGILGSTYGWIPDVHDVFIDSQLLERYGWVEQAALEGRSLTEMEFIHGVLNDPGAAGDCATFYHRTADAGFGEDEAELRGLIERTEAAGYTIGGFSDPEELGRMVRRDLLALIDRTWPEDSAPDDAERERLQHRTFAANRTRAYIPRSEPLARIEQWIAGDAPLLVVSGPSGLGKSSLLAYVADSYRRRAPDAFVAEHYCGASNASTSIAGTVQHLLEEIIARFAIDESPPSEPSVLEHSLADWLFRLNHESTAEGARSLIVIDALNQLEPRAEAMLWLPTTLPEGVRLLVSTTPGDGLEVLRDRGCEILPLTPIADERVRQSIVVRYLGEFHKGIDPISLRMLCRDPKAESPIFLRVVAEELRLHARHESVGRLVEHYVAATDLDDVFQRVLERMEGDFGTERVRSLLTAIWASRSGLGESELLEIDGSARLELSQILFSLDYHLQRHGGHLAFFHDYLRHAVDRRYIDGDEPAREAHARVARYFASQPPSTRRAAEEPWQWNAAGQWDSLWQCVSSLETFDLLSDDLEQFELIGYWNALAERYDMSASYAEALTRWEETGPDATALCDRLHALGTFLCTASRLEAARSMFDRQLDMAGDRFGPDDVRTARAHDDLGQVMILGGEFRQARAHLLEVLRIHEVRGEQSSRAHLLLLDNLASVYYALAEYDQAMSSARHALDLSVRTFGDGGPETISRLHSRAAVTSAHKEYDRAIEMMRDVVARSTQLYGADHPYTCRERYSLGATFQLAGRYREAIEHYRAAVVHLRLALGEHVQVATVLYNIGTSLLALGEYPEAESTLRDAFAMQDRLVGRWHPTTLDTAAHIAAVLMHTARARQAADVLSVVIPAKAAIRGWTHPLVRRNVETFALAIGEADMLPPDVAEREKTDEPQQTFERLCRLAGLATDRREYTIETTTGSGDV